MLERMRRLVQRGYPGFSLIEVLVALTLLAVVMLVLTKAFLTIIATTSRGGNQTVATGLAMKKLDEIRARVEAQPDRGTWRGRFCDIAQDPPIATDPPVPFTENGAYRYRVRLNQEAVRAAPLQEALLLPDYGIERGTIPPWNAAPDYNPDCAEDNNTEDRLRWVTVEVFYRSGTQPIVKMATAIIRGAYHRGGP